MNTYFFILNLYYKKNHSNFRVIFARKNSDHEKNENFTIFEYYFVFLKLNDRPKQGV